MKIAILGAGAFGTALGGVLANKGYDIDYYDSRVERERLADVLDGSKVVVLCVPSKAAPHVLPHLPKNKSLIVATKGILSDGAFAEFKDWMVLSGPGYADDIKAARLTHLTATDKRVVEMFGTDYLDFDETEDKKGVLMCGALKNVYAIKAGVLGIKPGTKAHEKYLQTAAAEMKVLLAANGAEPETVDLNCGIGDLRITCYYPSRNYEYGQALRAGLKMGPSKTVEGLSALKRIKRREIIVPEGLEIISSILAEVKYGGR